MKLNLGKSSGRAFVEIRKGRRDFLKENVYDLSRICKIRISLKEN